MVLKGLSFTPVILRNGRIFRNSGQNGGNLTSNVTNKNPWLIISHVTGYPARSRDRSCDRHTAIATRPSHPWPGHAPGYMPGYVPGHVMSHVPGCVGTLDHGNLPRPLALWHPRPLLPFGPWPLFPRGQHPSSTIADGGLRLSAALGARGALGPWRPPTYGGLWPMGHPWPR